MGRWKRVVMLVNGREEECTVPSCWIRGSSLLWPPVANAESAIRNCRPPAKTWKTYKLLKVKLESDRFSDCENCHQTTEVESGDDEPVAVMSTRRRAKKRHGQCIYESEDEWNNVGMDIGDDIHDAGNKATNTDPVFPKPPAVKLRCCHANDNGSVKLAKENYEPTSQHHRITNSNASDVPREQLHVASNEELGNTTCASDNEAFLTDQVVGKKKPPLSDGSCLVDATGCRSLSHCSNRQLQDACPDATSKSSLFSTDGHLMSEISCGLVENSQVTCGSKLPNDVDIGTSSSSSLPSAKNYVDGSGYKTLTSPSVRSIGKSKDECQNVAFNSSVSNDVQSVHGGEEEALGNQPWDDLETRTSQNPPLPVGDGSVCDAGYKTVNSNSQKSSIHSKDDKQNVAVNHSPFSNCDPHWSLMNRRVSLDDVEPSSDSVDETCDQPQRRSQYFSGSWPSSKTNDRMLNYQTPLCLSKSLKRAPDCTSAGPMSSHSVSSAPDKFCEDSHILHTDQNGTLRSRPLPFRSADNAVKQTPKKSSVIMNGQSVNRNSDRSLQCPELLSKRCIAEFNRSCNNGQAQNITVGSPPFLFGRQSSSSVDDDMVASPVGSVNHSFDENRRGNLCDPVIYRSSTPCIKKLDGRSKFPLSLSGSQPCEVANMTTTRLPLRRINCALDNNKRSPQLNSRSHSSGDVPRSSTSAGKTRTAQRSRSPLQLSNCHIQGKGRESQNHLSKPKSAGQQQDCGRDAIHLPRQGIFLGGPTSPSYPSSNRSPDEMLVTDRSESPLSERFPMSDGNIRQLMSRKVNTDSTVIRRCSNTEELEDVEKSLDERTSKKMISQLSRLGGGSARELTYAIMRKLMSYELMTKFSLQGKKGKLPFQEYRLYAIVTGAVLQAFGSATEREVRLSLENCLKYAPHRLAHELASSRHQSATDSCLMSAGSGDAVSADRRVRRIQRDTA